MVAGLLCMLCRTAGQRQQAHNSQCASAAGAVVACSWSLGACIGYALLAKHSNKVGNVILTSGTPGGWRPPTPSDALCKGPHPAVLVYLLRHPLRSTADQGFQACANASESLNGEAQASAVKQDNPPPPLLLVLLLLAAAQVVPMHCCPQTMSGGRPGHWNRTM
jgi:pimeloyl-ACP methyl ester carboxylesterase